LCSRAPRITRRSANSVQHSQGMLPLPSGGPARNKAAHTGLDNKNGPPGIPAAGGGVAERLATQAGRPGLSVSDLLVEYAEIGLRRDEADDCGRPGGPLSGLLRDPPAVF
jgi:hypothetical protein